MEGDHCYRHRPCDETGLTLPVRRLRRTAACTVIGGYVYRGAPTRLSWALFLLATTARARSGRFDADAALAGEPADANDLSAGSIPSSFGEDESRRAVHGRR